MAGLKIWSTAADEETHLVVLKDGTIYGGSVKSGEQAKIVKAIEEGEGPPTVLGEKCPQAPLDDVTRVVANSVGNFTIECDGTEALKLPMCAEGIKVLETIQDVKGERWDVDIESKMRIWPALVALAIGIVMGGGMIWAYFGVTSGQIRRIHWLFAWLINSFGPVVLLITAALVVMGCMAAFGYYLTHPAEIWTLEEE